jgi:hypothetical protein
MATDAEHPTEPARVTRTGIALVHAGELVLPAAGSEAQAEAAVDDPRAVIEYHFPVEIEVRGPAAPPNLQAVVDAVMDRLAEILEQR